VKTKLQYLPVPAFERMKQCGNGRPHQTRPVNRIIGNFIVALLIVRCACGIIKLHLEHGHLKPKCITVRETNMNFEIVIMVLEAGSVWQ